MGILVSSAAGPGHAPEDAAQRYPPRPRRQDGRFRGLGHAHPLRLAARRAPSGAPRVGCVRRQPHDRGRPSR
ncbi:hypothetical protein G6F59_018365 [Rhizopus arrhizus]|nr:hypothetical protein G6F59_018365 [Rhizopus arrhizus]